MSDGPSFGEDPTKVGEADFDGPATIDLETAKAEISLTARAGGGTGSGPQGPEGGEVRAMQSGWRLTLAAFVENRLAVAGVGIILFFTAFCFLGPIFYPGNAVPVLANMPPGPGFPLGTEGHGFNELQQIMVGGQASLEIGLLSALLATVVGTLFGTIAGLVGGIVDAVMMRFVDMLLSIPFLFIVLIISAALGNTTVGSLSLLLGLFSWLVPARLVRGEVLTLRNRDFVHASKVMGATGWHLGRRHLIPNALSVVIVNITFQVADAILAVSTLGFLGFGLSYPNSDWGDLLSNGTTGIYAGYWWEIYPVGVCLVLVVMAFNFIGDAARDSLEGKLRRR